MRIIQGWLDFRKSAPTIIRIVNFSNNIVIFAQQYLKMLKKFPPRYARRRFLADFQRFLPYFAQQYQKIVEIGPTIITYE